jgi:lipopolysaccharide export system permease protein
MISIKIYQKYISLAVSKVMAFILLIISFTIILSQFLRLINKYLGKGSSLYEISFMVILFLPNLIFYTIPIALVCSCIYTYHKLQMDSELTAMFSCGISKNNIGKTFILFAGIITIISYFISFYLNPLSKKILYDQKNKIQEFYVSSIIEEKVFNHVAKNITIYIGKKHQSGILENILIQDNRSKDKSIITAYKASFVKNQNTVAIELYKGSKQRLNKNNQIEIVYFDNLVIVLNNEKNVLASSNAPETFSIHKLIYKILTQAENKTQLEAELHKRLSWPIVNIMLVSIAIFILIRNSHSRNFHFKPIAKICFICCVSLLIYFFLESKAAKSNLFLFLSYSYLLFLIAFCLQSNKLADRNIH